MSKIEIFNRLRAARLFAFYLIFSLLIIAENSPAQQTGSPVISSTVLAAPVNLDFEQGTAGQVPIGWQSLTQGKGYTAETTDKTPQGGTRAVLLRKEPGALPDAPAFGNLMQAINAAPFRGKRIRLRGAVRLEAEEPTTRAQLWMRVDRLNNQTGFLDSMANRPITSKEWQFYEIVGDVDEDAEILNFGMIMSGRGTAYLDSVTLEDLGKTIVLGEPPRALTKRGLENITAFTKLYGYVRHFHPSDEAAAADWDAFAIEGVREAEKAKNARELANTLTALFRPIAPTVRVYPAGKSVAIPTELMPPHDEKPLKVISWRHIGFGHKASPRYGYESERISADVLPGTGPAADAPNPRQPFKADLGGGVSCLVPLALYADSKGTIPQATRSPSAPAFYKYSGKDRSTRLAAVAQAWNVLQHFYPYFDVVRTDWQAALGEALASAATDTDDKTFLRTLQKLIVNLHDGHGFIGHSSRQAMQHSPPVVFSWVENKLVITSVAPEGADGLKLGDIVLKIDGKPSLTAVAEEEALISGATAQWRRYSAVNNLRFGAKDSEMTLEVQDAGGKARTVALRRSLLRNALTERQSEKIAEIKPGIFYVDLDRVTDEDFQSALPKLAAAQGIVFDIRGYPKVSFEFIKYLTGKPLLPPLFLKPIVTRPDHNGMTFTEPSTYALDPKTPRLTAKMAFLTDGRAISAAESVLGIIENYKLGEIVGETTAGTNGNINPFDVIGNYRIVFTGMKVLRHDGSQHHGIGIKPTMLISRTVKGIREKRDEQLEKAVTLVSN